jgi:hypothetical protein
MSLAAPAALARASVVISMPLPARATPQASVASSQPSPRASRHVGIVGQEFDGDVEIA